MKFEIRSYHRDDADAVVQLWTRCGLVRPWNDPLRDIARKLKVQSDMFLVAHTGDQIVGTIMVGYEGHRGWLNYLAVDPRHRCQGIGKGLMAEAETMLRAAGCPKINLQVRSGNQAAIAFYRRVGFTEDDVISMGKRLERDE